MNKSKKLLTDFLILFFCGFIPVFISQLTVEKHQSRKIHIENFRYGKSPSVIRCNRGDTLCISFSTRDTGHSFFLEEFDMDVKVSPNNKNVLQFRASDPSIPPQVKEKIAFIAEHHGIYKYLISKSNFRCHVWCGPMHAFEQGKLIIAPNFLLHLGLGLLFSLFIIGIKRIKSSNKDDSPKPKKIKNKEEKDLFIKFPWLKSLVSKSWFQPTLMLISALFLYIVILTALFGTQMSGRNLSVMLIWIVWLFLIISIFTPLGGKIWCTVCPLPMLGEFLQRRAITKVREGTTKGYRNHFWGLNLSWPNRLNNGWLRLIVFLITATFSTTFVAKPRATGIVILLLFLLATLMALIWKLRSFCLYVCPINVFLGNYARLGKLMLRKSDSSICNECKPIFCEKGSYNGWACPYGLNVNKIEDNVDCGLCTQCFRSCLFDNVSLKWRKFGSETSIKNTSMAWSSMVLFIVGVVYTIVYLGHWPCVRDYVNILDKGNWDLFAIYTIYLWSVSLVIFPLIVLFVTKISKWYSGVSMKTFDLMKASTGSLLPIGLFIWMAFSIQMLSANLTFVGQSLSDPFGWGWNLLSLAGTPWKQLFPHFIPWIQVTLILFGFVYSFRNLWSIWLEQAESETQAFKGVLPMAVFLFLISCNLIIFYAN